MEFSLFYFADAGSGAGSDAGSDAGPAAAGAAGGRYRLLLDGARFADANGFAAVWTPERHFHPFGGSYPAPAVTSAALAATTERIGIRAGSVVAPLHHVLRLAEEWSVVDNLSAGRVGLSLASGWSKRDFVLRPEAFDDRRELNHRAIGTLRALWRGEPYRDADGAEYQLFPTPVGPLRLWLTCSGTVDGFRAAGRAGVGVLTHLVKQDLPALARNIAAYRAELAATGSDWPGQVTLMVHTYLDEDTELARATAREPLGRYLASAASMLFQRPTGRPATVPLRAPLAVPPMHAAAAERYLTTDGLVGTVDDGMAMVRRCRAAGVDELACLVDFGVGTDAALAALPRLDVLRRACAPVAVRG